MHHIHTVAALLYFNKNIEYICQLIILKTLFLNNSWIIFIKNIPSGNQMTLHLFTQIVKLQNDSHRENFCLLLYFPLNIYRLLCDHSRPKVFSSQAPLALIIMNKITSNAISWKTSEDMEYLQMEKSGEYEGVNLRVLLSGCLTSLSLWLSFFHVISFFVNPSLSGS